MHKTILALTVAASLGGCATVATDLNNATGDLTRAAQTATTIAPTAASTAAQVVSGGLNAGAAIIDGIVTLINIAKDVTPLF